MYSIIVDISDRIKAERQLAESCERLASVIEAAKAGVWDWDLTNGYVYYDTRWKQILGYGDDALEPTIHSWTKLWHPEDKSRIQQAMVNYMSGKTTRYKVLHRLRHKNGCYRWILTIGKLLYGEEGKASRWTGFITDVTEKKNAQESERRSFELLRNFTQALPGIGFIVDEDGRYLEVFGSGRSLLYQQEEKIIGRTIDEIFPPTEAQKFRATAQKSIQQRSMQCIEYEMDVLSGRKSFECRTAPMDFQVNGKKTVACVIVDATEHKKAERMLRRLYERKRKADLLNDIIVGKLKTTRFVSRQLQAAGVDLKDCFFCAVLTAKKKWNETDIYSNNAVEALISKLDDFGCIAWVCHQNIVILCSVSTADSQNKDYLSQVIRQLLDHICPERKALQFRLGVSDIYSDVTCIAQSYSEACKAIERGRKIWPDKTVYYQNDLGILGFLDEHQLEAGKVYAKKTLDRLIQYDRQKKTNLLETLEQILKHNHLKVAAEKCYMHYKTLLFRKKRIEAVLGVNLDDFETKANLSIALKILRIARDV